VAQFTFIRPGESPELGDDIRELFDELAAALPPHLRASSGAYHPPLDVYEDDDSVEIVVDVSGVPAAGLRVLFRAGVVLVAGEKAPQKALPEHEFHLVEREFGRFARAIRVPGAFDVARATATLVDGELTLSLPKQSDRRGQPRPIPITLSRERPA
jgi:HSP20 family protein